MTDREIVEALIGRLPAHVLRDGNAKGGPYLIWCDEPATAKHILADWRVAGACLERLTPVLLNRWIRDMKTAYVTDLLKDPRAICEAFAKSTEQTSE